MYDVNFGGTKHMTKRLSIALVAVALLLVLVTVMPASAYTGVRTNISQGATIYIGEQGLNLTPVINYAGFTNTSGGPVGTADAYTGKVGWWASAAVLGTTSPTIPYTLTGINNFAVSPSVFAQGIGNWYIVNQSTGFADLPAAFVVADPSISMDVWDFGSSSANVGLPASGKSIVQGEWLGFKIDTNQFQALGLNRNNFPLQLGNVSSNDGYIDITVKDASGTTLTGLLNGSTINGGTAKSIRAQNVSYQNPSWIWGTAPTTTDIPGVLSNWSTGSTDVNGQYAYPAGTYTAYATSKLNAMNDYYKLGGADYTGKTVSAAVTVTLVSDTVSITANKDSVVRSKTFSVTVTGRPSTLYHMWVKGTTSMDGTYDNQPPMIRTSQLYVAQDNYVISTPQGDSAPGLAGNYTYQNSGGGNVWSIVAHGQAPTTAAPAADLLSKQKLGNGTYLYANVTMGTAGTTTVEWATTNWTKAQTYTIRVEQQFVNSVPNTDNSGAFTNTPNAGIFKSDEVNINVVKGAVTIVAAGSQSYYLGEEIKFSGTNTETQTTYLFITGPNLPTQGGIIASTNPRAALSADGTTVGVAQGVAADYQQASVLGDNTWSWKWGTATVALDAGTYTIYAVSQPNNAAGTNLANAAFGTVSIIIKKPFVSATASQSTIAQGDRLFITGTAQGQPTLGVKIWILGKNYPTDATQVKTQSVNADASFSYEVQQAATKNLYPGQYFVVVQHPMQNNVFDIDTSTVNAPAGTVYVINKQTNQNTQGATQTTGATVFTLLGASSLQGSDAADALVQGINSPNVDDTYTKLQFIVETPVIRVNPVGDKHVGDKFTITASTNLAVDDQVLVTVYSSSFKPTAKSQSGEFSGATGTVKVTKGDSGLNVVSFDVDSSTFKPDEYIVTETAILQVATGTALFNVLEGAAPVVTTVAPVVTTVAPVVTTVAPVVTTVVPTTTPKPAPGYGALIALIGLGAVAFIVVRRH
jgi:PGF-CTERM protein